MLTEMQFRTQIISQLQELNSTLSRLVMGVEMIFPTVTDEMTEQVDPDKSVVEFAVDLTPNEEGDDDGSTETQKKDGIVNDPNHSY